VPSASGAIARRERRRPAAPSEPEAESAVFQGLRVAPNTLFTVFAPAPKLGRVGLAENDRACRLQAS